MATLKLDEITTQYRSFVNDQVLTADQLNTIIDYFEDQHRLTRVCLSGVGIVCGLDVSLKSNKITVSSGCGITTDGDLIKYQGATYTHFRPFKDEDAGYSKFKNIAAIEELILANDDDANANNTLSKLNALTDKVVVLYLENFAKEQTPCTGVNCDTQGQEQVANIRMLLLDKTEVEQLNTTDEIFTKHDVIEQFLDLPKIPVKRLILTPKNTTDYVNLMGGYTTAINGNPSPLAQLETGLISLFLEFNQLLQLPNAQNKLNEILSRLDTVFDFAGKNIPLDIQYRYDFVKDMIATYETIKQLLYQLRLYCCTSESAFPKHLLLGELSTANEYFSFRHAFYPSPIIPEGVKTHLEVVSLLDKMHQMATQFQSLSLAEIKITPSKKAIHDLSTRAIPFYYKSTEKLLKSWNFNKAQRYDHLTHLSYNAPTYAAGNDPIVNPLSYTIDNHDFYRIEGHLGRDYFDALEAVNLLKEENGLAFDVKVLSINETLETIDPEKYSCHFDDLNTILLAFLKEQECLYQDMTDFFSAFSTKVPGTNARAKKTKQAHEVSEEMVDTRATEFLKENVEIKFREQEVRGMEMVRSNYPIEYYTSQNYAYQPLEVVNESIRDEEGLLGVIIKEAIIANNDREPETIIRDVEQMTSAIPEVQAMEPAIRQMTVNLPAELIIYSRATSRLIPTQITEITETRISQLIQSQRDLCELVDKYQEAVNTQLYGANSTYQRQGFESRLELLLNQMTVNCCAAEKIKILMDDITKRKIEILSQKTLSKFVENHPGLDHQAGVAPGGTFIMVYMGADEVSEEAGNSQEIFDRFKDLKEVIAKGEQLLKVASKPEKEFQKNTPISRNMRMITARESATPNKEIVSKEASAKEILNEMDLQRANELLGRAGNTKANIAVNTVVADFCLPYLCCSDCAPINFIIPAKPVSLRLPSAHVCLEKDTQPLLFEVVPADGEVTADVPSGLSSGVTKNNDDKFVFDPTILDPSLYGAEIKFLVNGQITDATITVFLKPEFDYSTGAPSPSKDGLSVKVTFTTDSSKLPAGVRYEWDFGDKTVPANRFDENPTHIYDLRGIKDETITFNTQLTVTNGRCSHSVPHDLTIEIMIPELNIPAEVCYDMSSEESLEVPYQITPKSGELKTVFSVKYLTINKNSIVIEPGFNDYDKIIAFTIDGREVAQTLTVRKRPFLMIRTQPTSLVFDKQNQVTVQFNPENQNNYNEALYSYRWLFGDGSKGKTRNPKHTYTAPQGTKPGEVVTFDVELTLLGGSCEDLKFPLTIEVLKREG